MNDEAVPYDIRYERIGLIVEKALEKTSLVFYSPKLDEIFECKISWIASRGRKLYSLDQDAILLGFL